MVGYVAAHCRSRTRFFAGALFLSHRCAVVASPSVADIEDLCGRQLGEFLLVSQLDAGGCGAVYRAEQRGLGREAVVKVPLQRDDATLRRFAREAQLASRLDHPYATQVLAHGIEEADGLFWIAMELVHGEPFDRLLRDRGTMSLEEFVPFFERIAEVVQTAHEVGIVHRDLKPANIMVIERAGKLLPKLLDFGLARVLGALPDDSEVAYVGDDVPQPEFAYADEEPAPDDQPVNDTSPDRKPGASTGRTPRGGGPYRSQGQRSGHAAVACGSPSHMAPEQWRASAVGPAADLYALGVIAYQALAGRLPFTAATTQRMSELHCKAPVPPLGDGFPPALDRFFARALAKRPEERFDSAMALAGALRTELEARLRTQVMIAARQWQDRGRPADLLWRGETLAELERWQRQAGVQLTGMEREFVDACSAARRRAARNKRWLAALALAGVVGGFQYRAYLQTRAAERETLTAEVEQGRAALLHNESSDAQRHLGEAYNRGDHSPATEFMFSRALQPRLAELAHLSATTGRMWSAVFSPDGRQIVTTDDKAAQIWDARTNRVLFTLVHGDSVYRAVYSADGATLVTVSAGAVKIWNPTSGSLVRELRQKRGDGKPADYYLAAMSSDGKLVAAIDAAGESTHVWDANTGAPLAALRDDGSGFPSLAFSAGGRWLATSGGDDVRVFSTETWARVTTITGPGVRSLSWDLSGPRLLTGTTGGDASIWTIPGGGRRQLHQSGEPIVRVAFSPGGELAVTAARDGSAQVWSARSGALQSQSNLPGRALAIEFNRGSPLIVAANTAGTVVVSDAASGMPITVLEGPRNVIRGAHFDLASRRIVGASWDGTARVWDASPPYRWWSSPLVADGCGLIMSLEPDRRFVAVGCRDKGVQVWDTASDELLAKLPSVTPVDGDFMSAFPAVSAEGDRAAIARGNTVEIYELPGGRLLRTVAHAAAVNTVAFAPVGRDIVTGGIDGSVLVTRDGRDSIALLSYAAGVDAAMILADGRVVATDARAQLRVYDRDRGAVLAELALPSRAGLLRSSRDGRRMLTVPTFTGNTAPAVLWDLEGYRVIAKLDGNVGQVLAARFIEDDRAIITTGNDGVVRLWDGATGRPRQIYRANSRFFADATLSPDGSMVVAGDADGFLRFWDASSARPLWTLQAHRSHVVGVHFEGSDIVTRGFGGDVSRWRLPAPGAVIEKCGGRGDCAIVTP